MRARGSLLVLCAGAVLVVSAAACNSSGVTPAGPDQPPVAVAGPGRTVSVHSVVSFDGSGSHDPDGTITAYLWQFGDATSASGVSVSHAWATSGDFTVTLTVTDNANKTGQDKPVMHVKVGAYNGTYALTANPTQQPCGAAGNVTFVSTQVRMLSSNNETTMTSDWFWPAGVTVTPRPARGQLNGTHFVNNWTEQTTTPDPTGGLCPTNPVVQTYVNAWAGSFSGLGTFSSTLQQGISDNCMLINCNLTWGVTGNYIGP